MTDKNTNEMIEDVELPEDENLEEGDKKHDPANAEKQSVDATAKADDGVKKAPARKGDNTKQEPKKKVSSKAGLLNAMYGKMAEMNKDSLMSMYNKMSEEFDDELDLEDEVDLDENTYDYSDDLKTIVESEATLSEEFKEKTQVIFEAAVRSKIAEETDRLENEYQSRLDEELQETRDELVEKVDSYLNYVVEQWMEENELAIENGLRAEIAEDFMSSLKDLFVESYIEVPESKVDLVDELAEKVDELEESLNQRTSELLESKASLESLKRAEIVRENTSGLAETEIEKLYSLVESLDFEDEETFASKVKTVKESYFKKAASKSGDSFESEDEDDVFLDEETNSVMGTYLSALKATNKK